MKPITITDIITVVNSSCPGTGPTHVYKVCVGGLPTEQANALSKHLRGGQIPTETVEEITKSIWSYKKYSGVGDAIMYIKARSDVEFIQKLFQYINDNKIFDLQAYLHLYCDEEEWITDKPLTFQDVWYQFAMSLKETRTMVNLVII